ncbi:MAG: FtsW/RodA/SpoVE family cell cycle protein [Chloroflexi bacterium]|nr:FtsW/RodA/SpoVE family cell cycle protein [Chloroflexota bacterium]
MAQYAQARSRHSKPKSLRVRLGALPRLDYPLIVVVGVLLLIGFMLIFSGSYDLAFQTKDGNAAYYVLRQVLFAVGGLGVAVILARSDYLNWRRWSVLLMIVTLVALIGVLAFGEKRFGAQLSLFNGSVQPGEWAKLVVVFYIADWLSSKRDKLHDVNYGLIPFGIIVGGITGLVVLEPDYGTAILIVLAALAMVFMAGIDLRQLLIGGFFSGATLTAVILSSTHASERLREFGAMWNDPSTASDQMQQVMLSLKMGGVSGVGLGNGLLRVGYLPLAHTDSIFALAAIELGLIGVIGLLLLYVVIAYRGLRIALHAPSHYGQLLAFGATMVIVVQALTNVCVMTGVLPLTGIPLPFVSYGGSSLITTLALVGVLISVSRASSRRGSKYSASMDRSRRDGRTRLSRTGSR